MTINRLSSLLQNGHSHSGQATVKEEGAFESVSPGEWLQGIIVQYPRASLLSALAVGAAVAWLIKRR